MIGIYKITSPSGNVYIGQSVDIEKRFNTYKYINSVKGQTALYRSFVKYGIESHSFEVLAECSTKELNKYERHYQDLHNVLGKKGLNCLLTKCNDKSGKSSNKTKKKLSSAMKGLKKTECHKSKISESLTGRKLSNETKLKISKSQKLRLKSDKKGKIILNTQTGVFYIGSKEASESIGIKDYSLRKQLTGCYNNKTYLIYV